MNVKSTLFQCCLPAGVAIRPYLFLFVILVFCVLSTDPCGANATYDNYITEIGNSPSCIDPNPPPSVPSDVPYEACICKDGYILENREGDCILEGECGCTTEDGNYYSVSANLEPYEPGNSIFDKYIGPARFR